MMFSKLFCLITICPLTCMASDLDYFKEISSGFSKVTVGPPKLSQSRLMDMNQDEAMEECARQCRLVEYFCHSFAVLRDSNGLGCIMFTSSEAESIFIPFNHEFELLALYEIRQPERLQNLVARFSHNNQKPARDWASEILTKYGILSLATSLEQKQLDQHVLMVCKTAIHGEPPVTKDFRQTISGKLTAEQHPLSNKEIMDIVKSWAQLSSNSETFSEGFDTIVLTFLAIFSKNADQDAIPFYDPTHKMLFIQSKDLYLLVVSFGPDRYEILRHFKSLNNLIQTTITGNNKIDDVQKNHALELFKKIVTHVDQHATMPYPPKRYMATADNNDEQLIAAAVLTTVAKALLPPLSGVTLIKLYAEEAIFYRDLVTAVLSSIYGKIQASSFQKSLAGKTKTGAFLDIIINCK